MFHPVCQMLSAAIVLSAVVPCRGQPAPCPGGVCPPAGTSAPHPAVVRVVNQQGAARALGSGTLVDVNDRQGLVVTCAHLFREGRGEVTVIFPSRQSFGAAVLAVEATSDLAALLIERPGVPPAPVAAANAGVGQRLAACGYGPDGMFVRHAGVLVRYASAAGAPAAETLEMTGRARQGDSGGPIFNARREVVGVLFGTGGGLIDGTCCLRLREFLGRVSPRWRRPADPAPPAIEPGDAAPPAEPAADEPRWAKLGERCEKLHELIGALTDRLVRHEAATRPDALRDLAREAAAAVLARRAPDALAWLWPVVFGALGLSMPPTAALVAVKVICALVRWRRRRASGRAHSDESVHRPTGSLNDDYARQLQDVFQLSGRSPAQDATLGRDYDEELSRAARSNDPQLAGWARALRERVASRFQRIHGPAPLPAEPIETSG